MNIELDFWCGTVRTSGSSGARRVRPPLTVADLWFFMPQNAIFLFFYRSRLILSIIQKEIWPNKLNNYFYFNLQHFQFTPLTKSTLPL